MCIFWPLALADLLWYTSSPGTLGSIHSGLHFVSWRRSCFFCHRPLYLFREQTLILGSSLLSFRACLNLTLSRKTPKTHFIGSWNYPSQQCYIIYLFIMQLTHSSSSFSKIWAFWIIGYCLFSSLCPSPNPTSGICEWLIFWRSK